MVLHHLSSGLIKNTKLFIAKYSLHIDITKTKISLRVKSAGTCLIY